jgi:hypothetical protein
MATQFTFTLDSFQITDTRPLHKDTDYVSFTLVVNPQGGKGKPQRLKKSMGDLNNGTFPVNLSFPNVTVNPTDAWPSSFATPAPFSYMTPKSLMPCASPKSAALPDVRRAFAQTRWSAGIRGF